MDIDSAYQHLVDTGKLRPDSGQQQALCALKSLASTLERPHRRTLLSLVKPPPAPRGLYLWGPVGSGKSMLMDLFFESLGNTCGKRTHFHDFMAHFHGFRHQNPHASIKKTARYLTSKANILCFDEFTITHIADAMVVKRLFEELFDSGVTVIATSNHAPEDLYAGGLNVERFAPFIPVLRKRMNIVNVTSIQDYRRTEETVFWYTGKNANNALNRLWQEKTRGQQIQQSELHTMGRIMPIRECAGGLVRFCLEDLCGQPLGASDYLALAERFESFFISDVPVLTSQHSDMAARLIVLIDVLYDKKCALAVAAATGPDSIFQTRNPASARTASRLHEMCSPQYHRIPRKTEAS